MGRFYGISEGVSGPLSTIVDANGVEGGTEWSSGFQCRKHSFYVYRVSLGISSVSRVELAAMWGDEVEPAPVVAPPYTYSEWLSAGSGTLIGSASYPKG